MWKDFLYFSRGQRAGIIVLIILICIALGANYFLAYFFSTTENDKSVFFAQVDAFKKSLVSRDSLRQVAWQRQNEARQRQFDEKYKKQFSYPPSETSKASYTLFPFDPNTIDSSGLVRLGLKPFVASNILKYRRKGGRFKTIADFGKVYGVLPDKKKELEPYISIAPVKSERSEINEPVQAKRADLVVDLNSADTTLLMQVKGIGRGYAKGIVRFRQLTGGFVSVDQLSEVYGMRPENLIKIKPFCTINLSLVQKIKVNMATVQRLNAHPYLNFYQAQAIYELRRKKGKLHDIVELGGLSELTDAELMKIKPYLSFD